MANILEKFKGKEFWRTLNLFIFFVMYAIFFIVPVFFPDKLYTVGIIAVFVIVLYIAIQQYVYRKMEQKNAGRRVLSGWLDEEEDMGEEYEIPVKKISSFDRLSIADQIAVDDFIKLERSKMQAVGMREATITSFIEHGDEAFKKIDVRITEEKPALIEKPTEERIEYDEDEIEIYDEEDEEQDTEENINEED